MPVLVAWLPVKVELIRTVGPVGVQVVRAPPPKLVPELPLSVQPVIVSVPRELMAPP